MALRGWTSASEAGTWDSEPHLREKFMFICMRSSLQKHYCLKNVFCLSARSNYRGPLLDELQFPVLVVICIVSCLHIVITVDLAQE